MKQSKRIASLLLSVVLMLALSITAFAAETYTITINNTNDGHTYGAYQIFKGDLSGKVLSNIQWGTGISEKGQKALGNAADKAAELAESKDAEAFAEEVAQYLTTPAATSTNDGDHYTISGLAAGYYLVKDQNPVTGEDASTRYIIEVVEDSTVSPKSDIPQVEKKVKDTNDSKNETTGWQDSADYDIGDNVPFQLTATLGSDVDKYDTYKLVFHDTLSAGLTFNPDSVKVTVDGTTVSDGYTVKNDGTSLTITFDNVKDQGATNGSKVVVEYTAKLDSDAVIGSAGNPNEVYLEFSNNPNSAGSGETGKTPADKVVVFTYQLVVNKVDGEQKPLQGAGFTLYKKNSSGEYVAVGEEIKGGDMTTFEWKGLDDGDYRLVETTTPAGYNTIEPIEFTITASHEIESADPRLTELKGGDTFTGEVGTGALTGDVVNQTGSTLPETGGMGTTVFYVLGGTLAVAAVVLLITKKRMNHQSEI